MKALKTASADYNGGMSANHAVAKAAEEYDFNEKQAERLTEMFNTLAAITKEKDAEDPTGSCELASKEEVVKELLGSCCSQKKASVPEHEDYSFYSTSPCKTNATIEARNVGVDKIVKAASSCEDKGPEELNVSQRSLYKVISGQIDLLKSAAEAADDVVRNLRLEVERGAIKIAKAIESPYAGQNVADMFKAACLCKGAVSVVSEYSTKVAESDGGVFSSMNVFDSSEIDPLLKDAEEIERNIREIPNYEMKRDFYMSKASEAEDEMLSAVGLKAASEKRTLSDMLRMPVKRASQGAVDPDNENVGEKDAEFCLKMANILSESESAPDEVMRISEEIEKDAGINMGFAIPTKSVEGFYDELSKRVGIDNEQKRLMNVRRAIILADLMTKDPIIRDADPNVVTEAYKTMVMSSPRVSLDKSQVRAFLRSAVNSVAISPADAKVLGDVDKLTAWANVDQLTHRDSSIKDSNA